MPNTSPKGPHEDMWTPPPSLTLSPYLTISTGKGVLFFQGHWLREIYRDREIDERERDGVR